MRILGFLPIHLSTTGIPHTFYSICKGLGAQMVVPSSDLSDPSISNAVCFKKLAYRLPGFPKQRTAMDFLRRLVSYDLAYLFPEPPLFLVREARRQGKTIFLERVNCFTGYAQKLLKEEEEKYSLSFREISEEKIEYEIKLINLVDYVFCPSAQVRDSFLQAKIPNEKLLLSFYGWSPERFPSVDDDVTRPENFTLLFIGQLSLRKGVHRLIEYFELASIPAARLLLIGALDPLFAEYIKPKIEGNQWIEYHPFVKSGRDLSNWFHQADVFVLPSIEEGDPLVCYEALAHGLPVVASRMGAGSSVLHNVNGLVADTKTEFVDAIRELAINKSLRSQLAKNARESARRKTWQKVAKLRLQQMKEVIYQCSKSSTNSRFTSI